MPLTDPLTSSRTMIAGNWKMHGDAAFASALASALAGDDAVLEAALRHDVVLAPPFTWLERVRTALHGSPLQLAAQDCAPHGDGAYTGDIAPAMLVSAGCGWVILGHSERRVGHGESSARVRAKADAALAAGLGVILCVGEDQSCRALGLEAAQDATAQQLRESWPVGDAHQNLKIVVAYEPVWAIGTGLTALPEQIESMHNHLSGILVKTLAGHQNIRIVYGGSVKAASAGSILALEGVDGVLVGGASLKADEFAAIVRAAKDA